MIQKYRNVFGGLSLFFEYTDQHDIPDLYREVDLLPDDLTDWMGLRDSKGKLKAVTAIYDDSEDVPEGNNRVKPSSEITFFADGSEPALYLIKLWEEVYPNASRFCNIRIPEKEMEGIQGIKEALIEAGYRIECISKNLFTIGGRLYTVLDYAKNLNGREKLFPERDKLVSHSIRIAKYKRPYTKKELEEKLERSGFRFEPADSYDCEEITELFLKTFPVYGTYNLETTIPQLVCDPSSTSKFYVAKKDGQILGVLALEFHPFRFAELTDVAVSREARSQDLGTLLGYYALRDAKKRYGINSYFTDNVPHPAMNSVTRKLGADLDGIHVCQVRIITPELEEDLGRVPDALDLIVWSGVIK